MTRRNSRQKRTATIVATTALAAGMVALPGVAAADGCGGDPLDTAFCVVDEVLSFDPFTVLDEARELSDKARAFGQDLNENNQQFYDEYREYPSRLGMVEEFVTDQVSGLEDDRAAIEAAVDAATLSATRQANDKADDASEKADEVVERVNEEKEAAQEKAAEEQQRAGEEVDEASSDAGAARAEAEESAQEAKDDGEQHVEDQADYEFEPGNNWVDNTTDDIESFADDVSPVATPQPPAGPSGSAGSGGSGGAGSSGAGPEPTDPVEQLVEDVVTIVADLLPETP